MYYSQQGEVLLHSSVIKDYVTNSLQFLDYFLRLFFKLFEILRQQ